MDSIRAVELIRRRRRTTRKRKVGKEHKDCLSKIYRTTFYANGTLIVITVFVTTEVYSGKKKRKVNGNQREGSFSVQHEMNKTLRFFLTLVTFSERHFSQTEFNYSLGNENFLFFFSSAETLFRTFSIFFFPLLLQ